MALTRILWLMSFYGKSPFYFFWELVLWLFTYFFNLFMLYLKLITNYYLFYLLQWNYFVSEINIFLNHSFAVEHILFFFLLLTKIRHEIRNLIILFSSESNDKIVCSIAFLFFSFILRLFSKKRTLYLCVLFNVL